MSPSKPLYHRRRFPAEIISHCTWLYFRFCLSYRDVDELMAERGVAVTYETIRDWSQKFGGTYAKRLRSRARRPGDRWHLDEVYLSIKGKLQYLWRAVDQDGEVLDVLVQPRSKPSRRSIESGETSGRSLWILLAKVSVNMSDIRPSA